MNQSELVERRRNWRFIKGLVIGQVITLMIATLAGTVALIGIKREVTDKTNAVVSVRTESRYDSCFLLRSVVLTAAGPRGTRRANAFIGRSELSNCAFYALHPAIGKSVPIHKGVIK